MFSLFAGYSMAPKNGSCSEKCKRPNCTVDLTKEIITKHINGSQPLQSHTFLRQRGNKGS